MSRYSLKPLAERADVFEVAIGWDPGLGTYFAIVFGVPETDSDPAVLSWQGRMPGQIRSVAALGDAIADCAQIPADVYSRLVEDGHISRLQSSRPLDKIISTILGSF